MVRGDGVEENEEEEDRLGGECDDEGGVLVAVQAARWTVCLSCVRRRRSVGLTPEDSTTLEPQRLDTVVDAAAVAEGERGPSSSETAIGSMRGRLSGTSRRAL